MTAARTRSARRAAGLAQRHEVEGEPAEHDEAQADAGERAC